MTKRILITGLVAGTFDGLAAIIHLSILGKDPIRVFNFIASGVFGKAAYTGGLSMILAGIAFHYIIATIWTFIYFMIYPKIKTPRKLGNIRTNLRSCSLGRYESHSLAAEQYTSTSFYCYKGGYSGSYFDAVHRTAYFILSK